MDALNVKCNPLAWLKKNKCFCLLFALFKFVVLIYECLCCLSLCCCLECLWC